MKPSATPGDPSLIFVAAGARYLPGLVRRHPSNNGERRGRQWHQSARRPLAWLSASVIVSDFKDGNAKEMDDSRLEAAPPPFRGRPSPPAPPPPQPCKPECIAMQAPVLALHQRLSCAPEPVTPTGRLVRPEETWSLVLFSLALASWVLMLRPREA